MHSAIDHRVSECEGDVQRCCPNGVGPRPMGKKSGKVARYPEIGPLHRLGPYPSVCRPGCHAIPHFSRSQSKPWCGWDRGTRSHGWPIPPGHCGLDPGRLCGCAGNEPADWGPPGRSRWFVPSRGRSRPRRCCRRRPRVPSTGRRRLEVWVGSGKNARP